VKGGLDVAKQSFNTDNSIENIIDTYSNMVYRLAFSRTRNKSDADDIFQEVFLRYIKNNFTFENEEHRKAWLIRVTINCSKNLWASAWVKKTQALDENIIFETEEGTYLHHELMKLPIKYRTVIHLFYYEDLSVEEISNILQRKSSTIRTQLTRARRILKEILKEDYDV
jgi:RNA polymerase sigma-70 factor (ECF subfamily)